MRKLLLIAVALWLSLSCVDVRADYSVDVVHYACNPEEQKLEIWYEQLINTPGNFFDRPLEGAYNPSELIEWNQERYRESRPSKKSPIKKICKIGEHEIRMEIHPGAICQDGALPVIVLFSKNKEIYQTRGFGTSCSSGEGVGPEVVEKIVVTPGQVEIKSGFWFW